LPKNELPAASKALLPEDIPQLVTWLSSKDDDIRYQALLLLQNRSAYFDDVYPYWNTFRNKLTSDNSYQRSIGLMLIAENAKWDSENRMERTIDQYLLSLHDPKPITVRQCIQSLGKIASAKPELGEKIASSLMSLDLAEVKETMRNSILVDILKVLLAIRRQDSADAIDDLSFARFPARC